jgi:hypothetical protein
MFEGLEAASVAAPKEWRPAVEFDGTTGEATTRGYNPDEQPDFEQFLIEAGFDPKKYEIVGPPRTSRWQVARPFPLDPIWLTAYRFRFINKIDNPVDLPLAWANAKRLKKTTKPLQVTDTGKALVVALADFQLGKTDSRGGTPETLTRILIAFDHIEAMFKKNKYERILLVDVGDIIEGFTSTQNEEQLYSNDLSIMQQVDASITVIWDIIQRAQKYCDQVSYISIASNHCQWRINKQRVGKVGQDDWGIMIAKQIHRLADATKTKLKVLIPNPHDESLAVDVFDDGYHILGVWHGHQSNRPEGVPDWWKKQAFGNQPITASTIALTGHFHHLRVQEIAATADGRSRYWVQASTMDAGSNWYRLSSGEESVPGITVFELDKQKPFTGTVRKV